MKGTAIARRALLGTGLLGPLSIAGGASARDQTPNAPRTCGASPLLGCAVQRSLLPDPAYRAAVAAHFDMVVTEDALKWDKVRPSRDRFDFEDADAVVGFAEAASLKVRGHALVYHEQVPAWLGELRSRSEAEAELRRHIQTVVSRYRSRIQSWDVVNEFTADAPERGTGLRQTIWARLIGEDYIALALKAAHEADRTAQLVLSDYFLEYRGPHYDSRRAVMLRLVRELVRRKVPVHAVATQGHLYGDRIVDRDAVAKLVADLKTLGIDFLISELDVVDQAYPSDAGMRDRLAAQQAFELLDAVTEGGGAHAVLTWGVSDRNSWTSYHRPRADGLPTRPLALDTSFRPKPLMHVLQHFRRRVVAASASKRHL